MLMDCFLILKNKFKFFGKGGCIANLKFCHECQDLKKENYSNHHSLKPGKNDDLNFRVTKFNWIVLV